MIHSNRTNLHTYWGKLLAKNQVNFLLYKVSVICMIAWNLFIRIHTTVWICLVRTFMLLSAWLLKLAPLQMVFNQSNGPSNHMMSTLASKGFFQDYLSTKQYPKKGFKFFGLIKNSKAVYVCFWSLDFWNIIFQN